MLILSRKNGEKVRMIVPPSTTPTVIEVVLVEMRGDKSRLGFDAPREVEIARTELLRQGNVDALTVTDDGPDVGDQHA